MGKDFGIDHWNIIKYDLVDQYPHLTETDIYWRDGYAKVDMLKELAIRIGIPWRDLEKIVDTL